MSPGYLDKLGKPTATLVAAKGEKLLTVTKQRDAFVIAGKPAPGEAVIVVDSAYPVSESKDGDKAVRSVWTPAARLAGGPGAQTPKLPLDLVPTGTAGEFQVFFRGKPLAEAEVTLTIVSGWSKRHDAHLHDQRRPALPAAATPRASEPAVDRAQDGAAPWRAATAALLKRGGPRSDAVRASSSGCSGG